MIKMRIALVAFLALVIALFFYALSPSGVSKSVQNELGNYTPEDLVILDKQEPIVPVSDVEFSVPFTAQAPFGNWKDPRQAQGCEEASSLMAVYWARGKDLSLKEAEEKIIEISEYEEEKYGEFYDTSAEDTLKRILEDYFEYSNAELFYDISIEDIKREIALGNIVVVPVNGQKLKNPFYTSPGPERHMLVVSGYDTTSGEFITNDSGTRRGENFRYKETILAGAMRDYKTGFKEPIGEVIRTAMIIVRPV